MNALKVMERLRRGGMSPILGTHRSDPPPLTRKPQLDSSNGVFQTEKPKPPCPNAACNLSYDTNTDTMGAVAHATKSNRQQINPVHLRCGRLVRLLITSLHRTRDTGHLIHAGRRRNSRTVQASCVCGGGKIAQERATGPTRTATQGSRMELQHANIRILDSCRGNRKASTMCGIL